MNLIIRVLAAAWLLSGCVSTPPNTNSPGAENRDVRTGLCADATAPPCSPPRD
jgi:hypothetical protein